MVAVVMAGEIDRSAGHVEIADTFGEGRSVTIDELAEEPNLYVGARVILTREVGEVLGVGGFVLATEAGHDRSEGHTRITMSGNRP